VIDFAPPRFVTADGRRLAYEEVAPPPPADAVLLLCGIGAKRQGWYKQLPTLGARLRTLALDYRDVGDSDPLVPVENGRHLAAAIAGARLVVYPGVGHIPEVEIAGRFNEDLLGFLAPG
jgi:pimeloyl-ACP methyl ester carboxylesterase